MACPYFMPVEKLENGNWAHPSRLPLGCGWKGHCTAPGHDQEIPAQGVLEAFCNLGYAGNCSWAPPERGADSVRFAVNAPLGQDAVRKSAAVSDQAARTLRLTYICERDHRPTDHGELEFDVSTNSWLSLHPDARIQKMAGCFLESYLKKRS